MSAQFVREHKISDELAREIARIEQAYKAQSDQSHEDEELQFALALSLSGQSKNSGTTAVSGSTALSGSNFVGTSETKHKHDQPLQAPIVVDYWPSWFSNSERSDLANTPDHVDVVNLAFALPDGKGSLIWADDNHPKRTKEVIQQLKKRGKKVLLSVGGATAKAWHLDTVDMKKFAENIKKTIEDYGLDGVDLDHEIPSEIQDRDTVKKLVKQRDEKLCVLIQHLRKLMPKSQYLITYAGWSIGAYGGKGHEHTEWDNNPRKGMDIGLLSRVSNDIDWVNVMSYDAFDTTLKRPYNPFEAIQAFSSLMGNRPDKVCLGVIVGKQSWPINTVTSTKVVRPWLKSAVERRYKGLMFWYLRNDVQGETGEANGSFAKLLGEVRAKPGKTS